METLHRIGTFFILVGLALLVMFTGSVLSKDIHGTYLLLALGAFFMGYLFRRNKPVNDSGRFGTLRRVVRRSRKRDEEEKDSNQKH